jgi:hypothetical protein
MEFLRLCIVSPFDVTFGIMMMELEVDFFMPEASVTDTVLGGRRESDGDTPVNDGGCGGRDEDDNEEDIESSSSLFVAVVSVTALIMAARTVDTSTPPIGARIPRPVPLRVRRFID